MTEPTEPSSSKADLSGTRALIALILAVLSYALAQTMLVPTVGVLQRELHTTPAGASWAVLSSALLASAVLTPLISRLGDSYGRRRVLIVTLVIHLAGSIGAAAAWNIGALIAFRAVQGASIAILPLSLGLIREILPPRRVPFGLGLTSGLVGGAAGVGLVCGGLIVDHASWRWLFVATCVLILAALFATIRYVPESRPGRREPLDLAGVALLGGCLTTVLLALTEGPQWGWTSPAVLGMFSAAVLLGSAFLGRERCATSPLIDPTLLLGRRIVIAHVGAFLLGVSQFVFYVLIPKLAELPAGLPPRTAHLVDYGFGTTVTVAGLILLPGTLLGLPASSAVGRVEARLGTGSAAPLGFAMSAIGGVLLAFFSSGPWEVAFCYVVIGTGFGFVMAALPKLIHEVTPPAAGATANGINTVARTVGGAVGSQLGVAILASHTIAGTTVPVFPEFRAAFWTAAGIALLAAVATLLRARFPAAATIDPQRAEQTRATVSR
ncbi:MFS transporter [Streptomyces sp. SL13]|uniref:MFS transporter n=1 Tax=Streptantibioticus silvisoli TaxID=2705255 RepID=A0AA90H6B3_9ACTN|nr:MFS transporter [Streptantibioticus silvisoli]MDI5961331.1 MFS transporter [Streptantibioticus silvisoli]MDI5968827.1 MFS transporter [Streptantibioticus silvisoli]